MATRTQRKTVVFSHPFRLRGLDRVLPPGNYEVVTDEELIEGLSFPAYHRVSTSIIVPAQSHQASSVEMVPIDPRDLQSALDRDTAAQQLPATEANPASGRPWDVGEGRSEQGKDGHDRQNDRPRPAPRDGRPESHGPSPALGGCGGRSKRITSSAG